ncbi:MAG TPA: IPT/TIG domain-containing protein [Blastocatellia bacterium]|jgi:sugar lactone lactonase YvrE|nr:IPT/TIG domain-containing protein [Blastocatellia bacterium]
MAQPVIDSVIPGAGIEGGEIVITCRDFTFSTYDQARVIIGETETRPVSASPTRVLAPIPANATAAEGRVQVRLEANGGVSNGHTFVLGRKIAENLHPVANPAYDRDNGAIYTTLSGTRGQKVPVSVYKVTADGDSEPFLTDIVNPTGLAFNPDGEMFITSRYDGSVYRVTPFKDAEVFARDLGVATGIAFDSEGRMYVGDRSGTIYFVNDIGEATPFATIEPSMAAYHMAFGPDGYLYVTGPTLSSFDSVMRVSRDGVVSRFFTGLGRPQGLALDQAGNVYVAASRRGHRGIIRITPDAEAELVVAGVSLVGLCFDDHGNMILASNRELFKMPLGVQGYWPF